MLGIDYGGHNSPIMHYLLLIKAQNWTLYPFHLKVQGSAGIIYAFRQGID